MKKENQWRVSGGFSFQYFVSCGVFISWVVMNKAHLIEVSIYFLKVLVRRKKKKTLHFLLETSQPHIRCCLLRPAAWNEIWFNVFNALSVIKVFGDVISVAVSGGAVSLSVSMPVVERFEVVERTCWLLEETVSVPTRHTDIHLLTFSPAGLQFQPSSHRLQGGKQQHGKVHYRKPKGLHLQIFFCKYHIMFLTQHVPWAVQRALWECGWMSVLGPVLNWASGGLRCPCHVLGR